MLQKQVGDNDGVSYQGQGDANRRQLTRGVIRFWRINNPRDPFSIPSTQMPWRTIMVKNYCQICHQFDGCQYPIPPPSNSQLRASRCYKCKREIFLVHQTTACHCLGIDSKTLWRWRKRDLVTSIHNDGGRPLIIWSSLFGPEKRPRISRLRMSTGCENTHETECS
jgi:hypothetical protein